MQTREPMLFVATGRKGVGKTFQTLRSIKNYVLNDPRTGKLGRKVLIYDVNLEYHDIDVISIVDLPIFSKQTRPEIRRVVPKDGHGRIYGVDGMTSLLDAILQNYRGGLLVLEDINRYLTDTRSKEIIGLLATVRHRDLDVIVHLQSLSPVTTRMWQNTNVVRFHYQMDDIDRIKNRVPNYDMYKIAQNIVNKKYHGGDKRFFCYVNNEESHISGLFSKRDFIAGVDEYLTEYPSLVAREQKKFGKDEAARLSAIKSLRNKYMQYYGNRNS